MAFGVKPWPDVMKRARSCMPRFEKRGLGLDCITYDDRPLALFGAIQDPDNPNMAGTWFIAAQEYFDRGCRSTLFCRRHMATVASHHTKLTFTACSASNHPMVDRWFWALGFQDVSDLDLFKVYRYCRK